MNGIFAFAVCIVLSLSPCYAQSSAASASPAQTTASDQSAAGNPAQIKGAFPVTLDKTLDSKKLKEGDPVMCQMMLGLRSHTGLTIPPGTKVIGHVTQAQARSKGGSESSLGLMFDKIQMANGQVIPIKGVLQAVGPSLVSHSGPDSSVGMGGAGLGGNAGANSAGTTAGPQSWNSGNPNGGPSGRMLDAHSQGVVGIKGLELNKDSVITSNEKEIKLESGTQFMVRTESEDQAAQ